MADYTTITNAQVDPEAPITSELMSALRDNPIAISEGASGAPKIQTAAIQDAAVQRAKLATGTSSLAGTTSSVNISLSAYSFFPSINTSGGFAYVYAFNSASSSADSPRFRLQSVDGGQMNYRVAWRFINV